MPVPCSPVKRSAQDCGPGIGHFATEEDLLLAAYSTTKEEATGDVGSKTVIRAPTISLDSLDSDGYEEDDIVTARSQPRSSATSSAALIRRKVLLPASPLILPRLSDDDDAPSDMDCVQQAEEVGSEQRKPVTAAAHLHEVPQMRQRRLRHKIQRGSQQKEDQGESITPCKAVEKLNNIPRVRAFWSWIVEIVAVFAFIFVAASLVALYFVLSGLMV